MLPVVPVFNMVMDGGWRPTVDNYLARVTKPRILEAIREGAGERAAQLISHLKKGDMAKGAECLLAESGRLIAPTDDVSVGVAFRTQPKPPSIVAPGSCCVALNPNLGHHQGAAFGSCR